MKLRSYKQPKRAEVYIRRTLKPTFPDAEFAVVMSPFTAYAFRYLIKVTKPGRDIIGGDVYVGY